MIDVKSLINRPPRSSGGPFGQSASTTNQTVESATPLPFSVESAPPPVTSPDSSANPLPTKDLTSKKSFNWLKPLLVIVV